jgi:hypothetical protein
MSAMSAVGQRNKNCLYFTITVSIKDSYAGEWTVGVRPEVYVEQSFHYMMANVICYTNTHEHRVMRKSQDRENDTGRSDFPKDRNALSENRHFRGLSAMRAGSLQTHGL